MIYFMFVTQKLSYGGKTNEIKSYINKNYKIGIIIVFREQFHDDMQIAKCNDQ